MNYELNFDLSESNSHLRQAELACMQAKLESCELGKLTADRKLARVEAELTELRQRAEAELSAVTLASVLVACLPMRFFAHILPLCSAPDVVKCCV
eukprot:SAG31_NODE_9268_length_1306_cov_1.823529_1_plen_96_part_00